ncbi:hypothetical protein MLD38_037563 [Melastoma candidum]|uniref:Uncharacterized protein n=1 Tax=Melastoma candidum TaxID=119954 RepID=A0ACB9LNV2_9MYRT|nr:hypothetical protein MLD38_037563 [Melastoma candidum]
MSSDSSIPYDSPSSSFTCSNYQVFLSFRGTDVRPNFLECFKHQLLSSGIDAFTDSDGIKPSEEINPKLCQIIHHAQVCIPIFSKRFPTSKTCLMEVKWMVDFGKNILPIFYGIAPPVVRQQLDQNGPIFKKHIEDKVPEETLELWKMAVEKATHWKGEELTKIEEGYHVLIDKVIHRLWELLRLDSQDLPKHLVDISHHVGEVLRKLNIKHANGEVVPDQKLTGKRVVVIQGQQGIGKTTLAKAVYNKIRPLYRIRGSCFLQNVRRKVDEGRVIFLQEKLIEDLQGQTCLKIRDSVEGAKLIGNKFRGKGVFIVLDDADSDWEQIEDLMGDLAWLGQGSKVLVTTNKRDIIQRFKGADRKVMRHKVGRLPIDKVEELFCKHAFQNDSHVGDFAAITKKIIPLLKGNPRYIELVGKNLYGKDNSIWKKMWEEMQRMLEVRLEERMEKLMKLIYQNFQTHTKGIFLDIACLFNGMDKRIPSYLWEAHYKVPTSGIFELYNSSWLNLRGNELQMPDLVVLLGKNIVKNDAGGDNILNYSRLWDHEDALRALVEVQELGSAKVNALRLEYDRPPTRRFSCLKLRLLAALRVLILCHAEPDEDLMDHLPTKLSWLAWKGCPKASRLLLFCSAKLLILDLSSTGTSLSTFAWQGWQDCIQVAKELKVLNFSGRFVASQIFPLPTSLEHLILERCILDLSSVNVLPKLLSLNIKQCKLVKEFPPVLGEMEALEEIVIDGTDIKAITLPENLMKQLKVLSARKCIKLEKISEFPDYCNMKVLSFEGCGEIKYLPDSIEKLQHLEELDLSETMISELTRSFDRLEKLKILRMRRTNLEEFPKAIQRMGSLSEIDFSCSGSMKGEYDVRSLSSLRILKLPSPEGSRLHMSRTAYCNLEIVEYDGEVIH